MSNGLKMTSRDWMVSIVVYVVLGAFVAGVGYVAYRTAVAGSPPTLHERVKEFLLAVGTVLAANMGAYFGISGLVDKWDEIDPIGRLQKHACWVYGAMLIVAAIAWAIAGFPDGAPLLPELWSSGVGIILAIVGAALGVKSRLTQARSTVILTDSPAPALKQVSPL